MSTPSSNRAAESSSAETNWLEADASIVDLAAADGAGALDRERQGAAAVVVDLDAERLERLDHAAHRAHPRARVAVEADVAVGERGDRAGRSA